MTTPAILLPPAPGPTVGQRLVERRPAPGLPPGATPPGIAGLRMPPAYARWAVALAVWLCVSKFHGYLPILITIKAPLLTSMFGLFCVFACARDWRPGDLTRHWIPRAILVIVIAALGGIPTGIYPGNSLTFFLNGLLRTLLLATAVFAIARTPAGAAFMARTVAVSCLTAAALALILGRQDSAGRLMGAFAYDPNDLALIGAVGIPLVVWWWIDKRNRLRTPVLLIGLPLLLNVILKSDSRGGFLAMIGVVLGFIFLGLGKMDRRVKKAGLIVGLGIVAAAPFFPARFYDRLATINDENDYNRTSPRGRKQVWMRGIGYALEYPIFGVGIANFNSAEGRLSAIGRERAERKQGWKWSAAHSSYVQALAEMGFTGGPAFIVLVVGSTAGLITLHRRRRTSDPLPPFLALALLAFAIAGAFLSWAYYDLPYVLFALACATLMMYRPPPRAIRRQDARLPSDGISTTVR